MFTFGIIIYSILLIVITAKVTSTYIETLRYLSRVLTTIAITILGIGVSAATIAFVL